MDVRMQDTSLPSPDTPLPPKHSPHPMSLPSTPFAHLVWGWTAPGCASDTHACRLLSKYASETPLFARLLSLASRATDVRIVWFAQPGHVCCITGRNGAFCRGVVLRGEVNGLVCMDRMYALALWGLLVFNGRTVDREGRAIMGPDPNVEHETRRLLFQAFAAIDVIGSGRYSTKEATPDTPPSLPAPPVPSPRTDCAQRW